ncbi:MAG: MaoC family dehydratase N-terminal domain-containing protein [Alphaproteobacteria bacterium]|nr:MaoC family dehydratase N-terminal domain-containing protein [Alphaproteobacteria bacterium]
MARGLRFSQFEVGTEYVTPGRTVTEADVVNFAGLSGDFNPLHIDATFAAKTPFEQRIAHGMLAASISTGLGQLLGIFEGTTLALMSQTFEYKAPVFFGDTIRLRLTVQETKASSKGGKGVVTFASDILNQSDTVVVAGSWVVLFRD